MLGEISRTGGGYKAGQERGGRKSIRRVKVIVKTRKGACRPLSTTIDRRETVAIKSKALTPNYNRRKLVCVSV